MEPAKNRARSEKPLKPSLKRKAPVSKEPKSAPARKKVATINKAEIVQEDESTQPFEACRIIVGSYERILLGLTARFVAADEPGMEPQLQFTPIFNFPAHLSCIKTCAALNSGMGGRGRRKAWLATGGTDEIVKIWDLGKRREVGSLISITGVVNRLVFISRKFLLAVSSDATMSLYSTDDPAWSELRKFKGHMGRINDVAVHPGGRIALTVGQDRTLRMWDLFGSKKSGASGGKEGSSSTRLGAEGDVVQWSADGTRFAVVCGRELRIYSTDMRLLHQVDATTRLLALRFVRLEQQELIVATCEDGIVRCYTLPPIDTSSTEPTPLQCAAELRGHTKRVKAIELIEVVKSPLPAQSTHLAITISSDGFVHAYDLSSISVTTSETNISVQPIGRYEAKGRLVCLALSGYFGSNDIETTSVVDPADLGQVGSSSEDEEDSDEEDDAAFDGLAGLSESEMDEEEEAIAALAAIDAEAELEADEDAEEEAWGGIES